MTVASVPNLDALAVRLGRVGLVPVIRADAAAAALAMARRCADAGLDVIELTTTTPDWERALADIHREGRDLLIGVGTVLSAQDARRAVDGGAGFLVSPCGAPEARCAAGSVPFIEGGMTVSEVVTAARLGIAKLFPAHVGGVAFLRSVLTIAPWARIVPTGGIGLEDAEVWLEAGALAVGIGRDLFQHDDLSTALRAARGRRPTSNEGHGAGRPIAPP